MRYVDLFKRYENDWNNHSLYVWGHVMPWIDYYRENDRFTIITDNYIVHNPYHTAKYPNVFETNPDSGESEIVFMIKKSVHANSVEVFSMDLDPSEGADGREVVCSEMKRPYDDFNCPDKL